MLVIARDKGKFLHSGALIMKFLHAKTLYIYLTKQIALFNRQSILRIPEKTSSPSLKDKRITYPELLIYVKSLLQFRIMWKS